MGRLAVILGSSATGPGGEEIAAAAERHGAVVLQRHGSAGAYVLPHTIDHAANLRSLAEAGCDRVLAICSVGSLDAGLGVGSFVCPHDFIALQVTVTSFDDPRSHAMPGFDPEWRSEVLGAWAAGEAGASSGDEVAGGNQVGVARPLRDGGVYWQTNGPRFETPAEIGLIAAHADLVGMTLASECIVAGELELAYAAVCVVDNLANGIGARPLSPEELERDREANAVHLRDALDAALPKLVQ
jgi:purine nucleoside phosphorylase